MMKSHYAILLFAVLGVLSGCDAQNQAAPPPTQSKPIPYQRFVPISPQSGMVSGVPWHVFFALDTKTGNLCLTGNRQFSSGAEWVNDLPMCSGLRNQFPD
jgi:hypothetical protein